VKYSSLNDNSIAFNGHPFSRKWCLYEFLMQKKIFGEAIWQNWLGIEGGLELSKKKKWHLFLGEIETTSKIKGS
jgi:hypothetical protein